MLAQRCSHRPLADLLLRFFTKELDHKIDQALPFESKHFGGNSNDWREVSADLRLGAYATYSTATPRNGGQRINQAHARAIASVVATVCGKSGTAGEIYLGGSARNGDFSGVNGKLTYYAPGSLTTSGRFYIKTFAGYVFDQSVSRTWSWRKDWDLTAFKMKVPFALGPVPMSISASLGARVQANLWPILYASSSTVHAGVGLTVLVSVTLGVTVRVGDTVTVAEIVRVAVSVLVTVNVGDAVDVADSVAVSVTVDV